MHFLKRAAFGWAMLALITLSASAQTTNLLMLQGVTGDFVGAGHNGAILIQDFSWGIAQPNPQQPPIFQEIIITKPVDRTSPVLAQKCATGAIINFGSLFVVRQVLSGSSYDQYRINVPQIRVTNVRTVATPANAVGQYEEITLQFTVAGNNRIEWIFTPLTSGNPGTPIQTIYP